jgi:hypothetical protein
VLDEAAQCRAGVGHGRGRHLPPCPQKARKPERQHGRDERREQGPPATTGERDHEAADDHHQTENPGESDGGRDEPGGNRVQASEEVRGRVDEPVLEPPLQYQRDQENDR